MKKSPQCRTYLLDSVVGGNGLTESVDVMNIVVPGAIVVRRTHGDGLLIKLTMVTKSIDMVRRIVPPGEHQALKFTEATPHWQNKRKQISQDRRREGRR